MIVDVEFDKAASMRSTLAIEFTANSVRVMQLEPKGKAPTVRSFSEIPLSENDISQGIIQSPEIVGRKLLEALNTANPKKPNSQYIICLIPQQRTFLTVLDLPAVDKEELREILTRRAADIIPMEEDQVYWDWHRLETIENRTAVQLAAVPQELIDSYMQTFEVAKLLPLLFEPSATAASRVTMPIESINLQQKSAEPFILLELQPEYGVVSLMQRGGIVFSTDISLKSDSMAEKVIVLEQKIDELAKYSATHLKLQQPLETLRVQVYGHGQQLTQILPLLQERSSHQINLMAPKIEGQDIAEFVRQTNDSGLFPILGAAIRGLPNFGELATLNLIPQKAKEAFRKKELYDVLRNYIMFIAINSIFLVFMLLVVGMQIKNRVDDLGVSYASILAVSNSPIVNEIESSVSQLNTETSELNDLVGGVYEWQNFFDVLNQTTPDEITVVGIVLIPEPGETTGILDSWRVSISGEAGDRPSIIRFVNNLRGSEVLKDVKLPVGSLESEANSGFIIEAILPFASLLP